MKAFLPYLFFALAGLLGIVVHFVKRRIKDESHSSLFEYLFKHNTHYTATAFTALAVTLGDLMLRNPAATLTSEHMLATAFAIGYMVDSILNKDQISLPASPVEAVLDVLEDAGGAVNPANPAVPAEATPVTPAADAPATTTAQ